MDTRRVLATTTSMRNAALGLAVALNSFSGRQVDVAIIAFSALMIPPNMLFTVYEIVHERRKAKSAVKANQ